MFQFILLASLIGMAFAFPPEYESFEHLESQHDDDHYEHAPAPYHFEYGVKDPHTKDIKSQHEESDGHGNIKGSYSLLEADGSTRIVEYTADKEHGFQAKVKKIEASHHDEHISHEPLFDTSSQNYKFY